MPTTQEKLNALLDARDQGVLEVEYSDKKVRYRSLDEMTRIINSLRRELGITAAGNGRRIAVFSNGLTSNNSGDAE